MAAFPDGRAARLRRLRDRNFFLSQCFLVCIIRSFFLSCFFFSLWPFSCDWLVRSPTASEDSTLCGVKLRLRTSVSDTYSGVSSRDASARKSRLLIGRDQDASEEEDECRPGVSNTPPSHKCLRSFIFICSFTLCHDFCVLFYGMVNQWCHHAMPR